MPAHGTNRNYTVGGCRCDECKDAHRIAAAKDRERNRERVNATKRENYAKNPAVREKIYEWQRRNPDKVKESKRRYHEKHRERELERLKVRYQANRQEYIERAIKWREDNPERTRENTNSRRAVRRVEDPEWYEAEKERQRERMRATYAADPEAILARSRAWREANPDKARVANRKNHDRRRGVPYTPEAVVWMESLVDPLCTYCDQPATTIDHIIPVSRGGSGDVDNLTPACKPCNSAKHNQSLESFLRRRGLV